MEGNKLKDVFGLRETTLMTKDKKKATLRAQICICLEEGGKIS